MNKKQRKELENKIISVEETIVVLKHQEKNLLEVLGLHNYENSSEQMRVWVQEIFICCEYIVRLENSVKLMKASLEQDRRNRGGKKKD